MKTEFYVIQTGEIKKLSFSEIQKGIPVGWIPLNVLQTCYSGKSSIGLTMWIESKFTPKIECQ